MIVPAPVNEPGCFSELPGSACSFGVCALGDLRLWETHRDNWLLSQGDKWLGIWRFVQGIPLQAISGLHLILQILQSSSSAHPFKLEETTNTTHDNTRLTKQPNSGNNFRFRCKKKKRLRNHFAVQDTPCRILSPYVRRKFRTFSRSYGFTPFHCCQIYRAANSSVFSQCRKARESRGTFLNGLRQSFQFLLK